MGDRELYDAEHRRLRGYWTKRIKAGDTVHCTRCKQRIEPGQAWDLGHTRNRQGHAGPEHAAAVDCPMGGNRATSTHRALERERPRPPHPGLI